MSGKLEDEVLAGRDAQYLLEHPVYIETMSKLREAIRGEWERSPARDTDGREKLWMMLKLVDRIDGQIKSIATTGDLAGRMLEEEKRRKSFWRTT